MSCLHVRRAAIAPSLPLLTRSFPSNLLVAKVFSQQLLRRAQHKQNSPTPIYRILIIIIHQLACVITAKMDVASSPRRLKDGGRRPPTDPIWPMIDQNNRRQAEHEELIHSAMFQAATLDDEVKAQQNRLDSIEHKVNVCETRHQNDRSISLKGCTYFEKIN